MDGPDNPSLSDDAKMAVKTANVVKHPHLVAEFFHLKTELMVEHVGSTMGALAHWCRYEWQMRGSTHVHYFFWCEGAPKLDFLDDYVEEAVGMLGWADMPISEEMAQELVDELNVRRQVASRVLLVFFHCKRHRRSNQISKAEQAERDFKQERLRSKTRKR